MRHVRLVSFYDEPTGELGLGVKGTKGDGIFSAREGGLIAHDILEHQNGIDAIGCAGDELEAMGGIWQVRGRHGSLFNEGRYWRCIYESIAGDVLNIAMDWRNMESPAWYPRIGRYRTKPHDYDDEFKEILDKARPMIEREMRDDEYDFPMEAFMDNALHLMRMGFNKAKRRFGMGWEGSELFVAIRDAVQPHMKWVEMEGQEYILSYGNGRATCREDHYPYDRH